MTFNDAKGLERTIQSVLAQDASNVELIIVDGGSTDGSVEILKKYQTYIDYWLSEADNGIYDAMNKAVRLAQGQGMLFLNAGDFMFGALDFNRHPAPTFFPVIYLNAFNKLLNIAIKSYDQGLPSCHQGILFENHQRQFDIRYKLAADYDYYLQQGYRQLPLANSKGYIYYDNQGSSKQQARLRDQEIYQIIRLNFGWLKAQQFAFKVFGKNLVAKVLGL